MHLVESPALAGGTGESLGQALRQVVLQIAPNVVLAAHTPQGRDIACRPARRRLPTDCIQLSFEGDTVAARRPVYAGKATAEVEFTDDSLKVITVRPRSAKASEPDTARSAEVAQGDRRVAGTKTALKEIIAGGGERPDVTEAAIIVTGGRSLGSAENFSIIENFADSIGAAVGSSRAAVDAGYRPYRDPDRQGCVTAGLHCVWSEWCDQHLYASKRMSRSTPTPRLRSFRWPTTVSSATCSKSSSSPRPQ